MKIRNGFTLVETVIIIVVLGILATIVTVATTGILTDSRDGSRNASVSVIGEALERYYSKNGEYPSCSSLQGSPDTVRQFLGVDGGVLKAPSSDAANSIVCTDITASTPTDSFAYIGYRSDGTTVCPTNIACRSFVLKYKEEASGEIKTVASRQQGNLADLPVAPASTTTTTLSGSTVSATADSVVCSAGTPQYQIKLQANDGSWDTGTWGAATTRSTSSTNQGAKYAYRTDTKCVLADGEEGVVTEGFPSEQIRPITTVANAPVLSVPSAVGTTNNTTWSVATAPTNCPTGTSLQYSYAWYREGSLGWNAAWTTAAATTSHQRATDYQGYEYRVKAKARCSSSYANGSLGADSNEPAFVRTIDKPGAATAFTSRYVISTLNESIGFTGSGAYNRFDAPRISWTPPSCGLGTVGVRSIGVKTAWSVKANGTGYNYSSAMTEAWADNAGGNINTGWSRWTGGTVPVTSFNWSGWTGAGFSAAANPATTNVDLNSTVKNGIINNTGAYRQLYMRSFEDVGGQSAPVPISGTSHYDWGRLAVAYVCINLETQRSGYYGPVAASTLRTFAY